MISIDFIMKGCGCSMAYNKMRLIVGLFVIMITLLMAGFVYMLLKEKGTFDQRYSFYFQTDSASAFKVGTPVKYSGFDIGTIDKMQLNDDGTVKVKFSVAQTNRKWITEDSVLMITKPLLGSSHIVLYSAIDNDLLAPNSALTLLMSDDINDMITKLQPAVEKIINIINNIDKITLAISKDDSDLAMTLKHINEFSKKLAKNDSLLTSLTGSQISTKDFIGSINSLAKMMQHIEKISSHLDADIVNPSSSSIKELEAILKDVKSKLEKLDGTVESLGGYDKDLKLIKEQISTGVQKSNQIMDKVDALMQDNDNKEVVLP